MKEFFDYSHMSKYDPLKYSVKSKIIMNFGVGVFSSKARQNFLDKLKIQEITENIDKSYIVGTLRVDLVDGNVYQVGYLGLRDNRPIIVLERINKSKLVVSLFNEPKYIMRDHVDILRLLSHSTTLTNILSKLSFLEIYPCPIEECISISNVELKKVEMAEFFRISILRYFLLYIATLGIININVIWSQGLKAALNAGMVIVFIIYFLAFYIEFLFFIFKNKFKLEIEEE